jgi:hypothetical protein
MSSDGPEVSESAVVARIYSEALLEHFNSNPFEAREYLDLRAVAAQLSHALDLPLDPFWEIFHEVHKAAFTLTIRPEHHSRGTRSAK